MKPIQYFNVLNHELISQCIHEYNRKGSYDTDSMNKASPRDMLNVVKPILEKTLECNLTYLSGNYYKHNKPYLPHTDYKRHENNNINVVIPLSYTNSQPSLVIFDQRWELDSVTWCMHLPVQYFTYNIGVKGYPAEYPIIGSSGKDIDNTLYKNHLDHYPKHLLFGLTGHAYIFEPGSIIVFDNRNIHCTSKLDGEKLGLTLRFK